MPVRKIGEPSARRSQPEVSLGVEIGDPSRTRTENLLIESKKFSALNFQVMRVGSISGLWS